MKKTSLPSLLIVTLLSLFYQPAQMYQAFTPSDPIAPGNNSIYLPLLLSPSNLVTLPPNSGNVYYISPTGSDNRSGTSPSEAWATFDRALNIDEPWNQLQPGDSLILMDGVYFQSIDPYGVSGNPDNLITIRAQHDGKAVIDGQGIRIPVHLEGSSYFDIEGIVAKNSSESVFIIYGSSNNILRRVSGYNGNTNGNYHVFNITGNNNLLEDCVASGSGRKMIMVFSGIKKEGNNNTIRRCFASYRAWDGRDSHDEWPWNENFESYNGDYNIFENDIAYGYFANSGFSIMSQGGEADSVGNKVLGSIALMGGSDFEANPILWGNIRPQPSQYSLIKNEAEPNHRIGFVIGHAGIMSDNLLQDIFSWGNASLGLGVMEDPTLTNNRVNRATIYHNSLDSQLSWSGIDAFQKDLARLIITNSRIDMIEPSASSMKGEGARLQNRYVNGILKDGSDGTPAQPLWPWPMEQRIRDEMGISVTNLIASIISNQVSSIPDTDRSFLSISSPIQAFGSVKVGQSVTKAVKLRNTGSKALIVNGYQWDNGESVFKVSSGGTCPQPPFSLASSLSCTIQFTFSPIDNQPKTNYLNILSEDLPPYPSKPRIYVSGIGY